MPVKRNNKRSQQAPRQQQQQQEQQDQKQRRQQQPLPLSLNVWGVPEWEGNPSLKETLNKAGFNVSSAKIQYFAGEYARCILTHSQNSQRKGQDHFC
jgi:hypothetical protein